MIGRRLSSLREIADRSTTRDDFWLNLRDFLDGFYNNPDPLALKEEPVSLSGKLEHSPDLDAYLGAVAEHLARKFHMPVPPWSGKPNRTLHHPFFAFDSEKGRMFLLVDSPSAFRARNIFISADALDRV